MARAVWIALLVTSAYCEADTVERQTRLGKLRGNRLKVMGNVIEEYVGIPYAEPPIGDLRFKEPVPRSPWKGTYDATIGGSACPQKPTFLNAKKPVICTEDCLHLNVWMSQNAQKSHVLVWIHGGGFTFGSGLYDNYTGSALAAKTGFVIVSMNYRLGILGFLNANFPDAPGNQGLLDQNLALRWVQDNIESFGGDPATVTIFGASAGSMSVHSHILSPMSKGLFKRAMLISGSMYNMDFFESAHESIIRGNEVAQLVGCAEPDIDLVSNPDKVLQCLRSKKADELVLASSEVSDPVLFTFLPTYHDKFLPKVPKVAIDRGFFQDVEILTGVATDEAAMSVLFPQTPELLKESLEDLTLDNFDNAIRRSVLAWIKSGISSLLQEYKDNVPPGDKEGLRRAYIDYVSDRAFKCPVQFLAEKHSARGSPVYSYIFAHRSKKDGLPTWMGAPHYSDVLFYMAQPFNDDQSYNEEDRKISGDMVTMLASFAETGVPKLPGVDTWPKYTKDSPVSTLLAPDNFTEVRAYRNDLCELWRKVF
ncbi:acetylcholinesterase [Ixodes scapularis]|uniref:acetylcholinesterase n=1 Tax=Ixodes scapularis TaxID=6945 RepID=UPI001C392D28|nr:acetylcholinesterase [Ixodes scapularis]XP_040066705.2 acetylcholinesterase [Ixodes scapularis]